MTQDKIEQLESLLNYRFTNRELLLEALSHPSAKKVLQRDYQRLEFLGDRVLNLIIAEALFLRYAKESEGELAKRQNFLVCGSTVFKIAESLNLQEFVLIVDKPAIGSMGVADTLEAIIAAIYLDSSFEGAKIVVLNWWKSMLDLEDVHLGYDSKSALQELIQSCGSNLRPSYSTLKVEGPDHVPCFEAKVTLPDGRVAFGKGSSKKSAEKIAAAKALEILHQKK